MTTTLIVVAFALLLFCAVQATRFVVRYSRVSWRRTREGRHLMGFTRALALILWGTFIFNLAPLPVWVALVAQITLFSWLGFELSRRNYLLTINQRERRAAERAR